MLEFITFLVMFLAFLGFDLQPLIDHLVNLGL